MILTHTTDQLGHNIYIYIYIGRITAKNSSVKITSLRVTCLPQFRILFLSFTGSEAFRKLTMPSQGCLLRQNIAHKYDQCYLLSQVTVFVQPRVYTWTQKWWWSKLQPQNEEELKELRSHVLIKKAFMIILSLSFFLQHNISSL